MNNFDFDAQAPLQRDRIYVSWSETVSMARYIEDWLKSRRLRTDDAARAHVHHAIARYPWKGPLRKQDVDHYLAAVPEPQRTTLEAVRATLVALLPEAEQGIAYGVPCFKVGGKGVAGFGFYTNHCTYFPMSGSITAELADDLKHYVTAKGSIQFATDEPLPAELVEHLVDARRREIARSGPRR